MDPVFDLVKQLEPPTAGPSPSACSRQRDALSKCTAAASARRRRHAAGRARRKVRMACGAVGVVALAGGGIAAAAVLSSPPPPTPQQATTLYNHGYPDNGAHRVPGTRPTLNAEMVLCDYQGIAGLPAAATNGGPGEGFASAAPVTTPLTADMLLAACQHVAATGTTLPVEQTGTLCATNSASSQTDTPAAWPIVIYSSTDCAEAGDDPPPADLLQQVNQRRDTEAAIDAVPQSCPTEAETLAWVNQQLKTYNIDMQVTSRSGGPGGSCYLPSVQWWQPNSTLPLVEITASQQTTTPPGPATSTTTAPPG